MRLIKLKEVMTMTGLGRSSIYKFMANGIFPQSISLGERAVAWEESEIEDWIQTKVESRNEKTCDLPAVKDKAEVSEELVIKYIKNKFEQCGLSTAIDWLMKAVDWKS